MKYWIIYNLGETKWLNIPIMEIGKSIRSCLLIKNMFFVKIKDLTRSMINN